MTATDVLVTGLNSQPGWFLRDTLSHHPAPVLTIGRQPYGCEAAIAWRHTDLCQPPANLPNTRVLLHLAPIWLLPPLLDALDHGQVPRTVVAVSSASARTKVNARDPWERALAERLLTAESRLIDYATKHAIHYRIVRPTLIYGHPKQGIVTQIRRWGRRLRLFPVPIHATGDRQPIHAADLAAALWCLVIDPTTVDCKILELGGGERLAFATMLRRILANSEPTIHPVPVPSAVLGGLLRLHHSEVGVGLMHRLQQDQTTDDRGIWKTLGLMPRPFMP